MIARMSYVVCDECERHTDSAEGAEAAREVARVKGYVRTRGRDLCPVCAAKERRDACPHERIVDGVRHHSDDSYSQWTTPTKQCANCGHIVEG